MVVSQVPKGEGPGAPGYRGWSGIRRPGPPATAVEVASKLEIGRKPEREFHDLIEVDKAGMLECWVLFHWSGQGIVQEYPKFSKGHWKLLHDYVERFEIHGGTPAVR